MAVGARPTGASAGGADRCIAVGTDAAALGMLTRGIVAAEMADPWNTDDGTIDAVAWSDVVLTK